MALHCSLASCDTGHPARWWFEQDGVRYLICDKDKKLGELYEPKLTFHKIHYPEHIERQIEDAILGT